MSAIAAPVSQRTDHLSVLPRGPETVRNTGRPASATPLVRVETSQAFRLEIERVGTGDPPSLMLWGEE